MPDVDEDGVCQECGDYAGEVVVIGHCECECHPSPFGASAEVWYCSCGCDHTNDICLRCGERRPSQYAALEGGSDD